MRRKIIDGKEVIEFEDDKERADYIAKKIKESITDDIKEIKELLKEIKDLLKLHK